MNASPPPLLPPPAPVAVPLAETETNELYRAAMHGDWDTAQGIFQRHEDAKSARLTLAGMTALHVAAMWGMSEFVESLVGLLTREQLEMQDDCGRTALHFVAIADSVAAAKAMVNRNPNLPQIEDANSRTPFYHAALLRRPWSELKEMLEYLYGVTDQNRLSESPSTDPDLICTLTTGDFFDIAWDLLQKNPDLAVRRNAGGLTILHQLVSVPSDFEPSPLQGFDSWTKASAKKQRHLNSLKLIDFVCKKLKEGGYTLVRSYFMSYTPVPPGHPVLPPGHPVLPPGHPVLPPPSVAPVLNEATEKGVFEVVQVCLKYFQDLVGIASGDGRTLLHVAIQHRRVKIFDHVVRLVGGNVGLCRSNTLAGKNNILHLAAKLAPWDQLNSVPGSAFQIQRELQWFKAVDALVFPYQRVQRNNENKTPQELFFEEHEALLNRAKEWMKDTSNSCMLVATLVATVAFAARITVPGGNDNTGVPVLSKNGLFVAFSASNAVSMLSSVVSLLMFLSVQTSRYTKEDFLETLPKVLLRGLISLFIAVAAMMVAFGAALGMTFQTRSRWAYIPITVAACVPAIIFMRLQLPLLFQTLGVTFGPSIYQGERDPKRGFLRRISHFLVSNDPEA